MCFLRAVSLQLLVFALLLRHGATAFTGSPRKGGLETRNLFLSTVINDAALPKHIEPTFDSTSKELGNLISHWYLASMPFEHDSRACNRRLFDKLAKNQCQDGMCFGRYLAQQANKGISVFEPAQEMKVRTFITRRLAGQRIGKKVILGNFYDGFKAVLPHMGNDLWQIMETYAKRYNPQLLANTSATHCVVHYRVGDLVKYNVQWNEAANIVSTESIASAVARLKPQTGQRCQTIEILNGGMAHSGDGIGQSDDALSNDSRQVRSSWNILWQLQSSIRKLLSATDVFIQERGSPDEDFFKMATSPGLVFAAGSFAAAAAVAGRNNQVLSPAADSLFSPQAGRVAPSEIRTGWTTFEYDVQPVVVKDWVDDWQLSGVLSIDWMSKLSNLPHMLGLALDCL